MVPPISTIAASSFCFWCSSYATAIQPSASARIRTGFIAVALVRYLSTPVGHRTKRLPLACFPSWLCHKLFVCR